MNHAHKIKNNASRTGSIKANSRYTKYYGKTFFLDTNALVQLDLKTNLPRLLQACNEGKIRIVISDLSICERARQLHQNETQDRPISITMGMDSEEIMGAFETLQAILWRMFKENKAEIITCTKSHINKAQDLMQSAEFYFSAENHNDVMDAHIFAGAIEILSPEQTLILCDDRNLGDAFSKLKYTVERNAKEAVEEMFDVAYATRFQRLTPQINIVGDLSLSKRLATYEILNLNPKFKPLLPDKTQQPTDVLHRQLMLKLNEIGEVDKNIRIHAMAFAQAFAPFSKENMKKYMARKYPENLVKINLEQLCNLNILIDEPGYWLPNKKDKKTRELCHAAVLEKMDELITISNEANNE